MKEIEQIREATDLVEIVREYTKLRKKGAKMIGNCPFCKAKDTFAIDGKKGLFHCFGCGMGGDAFTFIMEKLNLSFPDALRHLSEKCHLENIKFECLYENVKNYQAALKDSFDRWMKEEIKDKEFIFKMSELITKGPTEEDELPF